MADPGIVNEVSADDVLWRRHERPSDQLYIPLIDLTLRSGSTAAIKDGPQSFPIIRDIAGSGGNLLDGENDDAIIMCRRAWTMGDPLYFDANNNGVANVGVDTLLSTDLPDAGVLALGHDGAPVVPVAGNVRYVDSDLDGSFDVGEPIYRDENANATVDAGDTLLVNALETVVGNVAAADLGQTLAPVPVQVKYLDLIREPPNTFNIGYPSVQGVTAVNANDVHYSTIAFPVHGVAAAGIGGLGVVLDDASQYLPPGPDFTLFEIVLVAHEIGHSFGLNHGDGIDDDGDGALDNADDPTAPVPGAGPGTLCDSNNVMSYCWLDNGTAANPDLEFIGVGAPTIGQFTSAQREIMRNLVLAEVPDRVVDPVVPSLVATRPDSLGELQSPFQHLDIAEVEVRLDQNRTTSFFSVRTRRPFPKDATGSTFYFIIDLDLNPATGAKPEALKELGVPSDFAGADHVGIVELRGRTVARTRFLRFDPGVGRLEEVPDANVRATVETLETIPDFPMGRQGPNGVTVPTDRIPAREQINLIVPIGVIALDDKAAIRAEFIARGPNDRVIDRARASRLDFSLPVFPHCDVAPATVAAGGATTVLASGLLKDRPLHLLLGDKEVAVGRSDGDGRARLNLPIPAGARLGPHLVTVGALAVTADCTVNVAKPDGGEPGDGEDGTGIPNARFAYTVPFLCGHAGDVMQEGVARGDHHTLITITNASGGTVAFAKRVSRALPEQQAGEVSRFETAVIGPHKSVAIECAEIRRALPLPMTAQFRSGTVLLYSDRRLDVAATYSSQPDAAGVTATQVVVVTPRPLER